MTDIAMSVSATEIMDRSAVLMNDPAKTDYTYIVLKPFLRMALDELAEAMADSHSSPTVFTSGIMTVPKGKVEIYNPNTGGGGTPVYPTDLVEIQQILERTAGSQENFVPMRRVEYTYIAPPQERLVFWSWESQVIRFNRAGATVDRESAIKYLKDVSEWILDETALVGPANSRSFLAYKTAAYAAQFVGENMERAAILDAKAAEALDRIESINNKGKQQIMTRHKPFRAAWKMRGGY